MMIRVGVVGFGLAGRVFHAPLISSVAGLELAAIVERHGNQVAERYPRIRTCRSLDEMLSDASLQLIVVATPSGTHFEMAREVIESGKHVIVDKPMAARADEIAELMVLAKKHDVLLIPFHNRRWDGDFLTVQKLIQEGACGRLVSMESRLDRWSPGATRRPWKNDAEQGGDLLLDLGTHLVDQALMLFGDPLAVSAEVLRERDGEGANDAFTVRLRFPGMRMTLGANALACLPGPRFYLRGTAGNYRKFGVDPQEAALNRVTRIESAEWGAEPMEAWGDLQRLNDGDMICRKVGTVPGDYRVYYEGVRNAVERSSPPPVSVQDAWKVARVLELAEESSRRHCEIECDWSKGAPSV